MERVGVRISKGKTVLSIVHAIVRAIVAQPRHMTYKVIYVGFSLQYSKRTACDLDL